MYGGKGGRRVRALLLPDCFTAEKAPGTILNAIDMPHAFLLHLQLMVEAIDLKCNSKILIFIE
jgi:hypothetical protein